MTTVQLSQLIQLHNNFLCVGLDTNMQLLPPNFPRNKNGIIEFNKAIIDSTKNHCIAYKINTAFYEAMGTVGWEIMEATLNYLPTTHFKIADAKRGDIGNTTKQYAKTFFETYPFDAVTVAPYMGEDSVKPFLEYTDKTTIVLALTSNAGATDFQLQKTGDKYLYEVVLQKTMEWGSDNNLMFVVGATKAESLVDIRKIVPEHFLLIPGVGTQGGSLKDCVAYGKNQEMGLLVNVGRQIMYADATENFAAKAEQVAANYAQEMKTYFSNA